MGGSQTRPHNSPPNAASDCPPPRRRKLKTIYRGKPHLYYGPADAIWLMPTQMASYSARSPVSTLFARPWFLVAGCLALVSRRLALGSRLSTLRRSAWLFSGRCLVWLLGRSSI